jgi:hypothetical protein
VGFVLYVEVGMLGDVRFEVPVRVQQRHPIIESESRQVLYRTLRGYPEMYTKMASLGIWSEELLERRPGDVPVSYLFHLGSLGIYMHVNCRDLIKIVVVSEWSKVRDKN